MTDKKARLQQFNGNFHANNDNNNFDITKTLILFTTRHIGIAFHSIFGGIFLLAANFKG